MNRRAFLCLLGIFCAGALQFPVFGLDIEGQAGGIYFDHDADGLVGGQPVIGTGYKFAGNLQVTQKVSDSVYFGAKIEQEPTLLDRLLFFGRYNFGSFIIQGGTFFAPSRIMTINPGVSADISFSISQLFFGKVGVAVTLLPIEIRDNTQLDYAIQMGISFPWIKLSANITDKSYAERRENFGIVSLDHSRYYLSAEFIFNLGQSPRTLSFDLDLGFQKIQWRYSRIGKNDFLYQSYYGGLTGTFAIITQIKLFARGTIPFRARTEDAATNTNNTARMYDFDVGLSWSIAIPGKTRHLETPTAFPVVEMTATSPSLPQEVPQSNSPVTTQEITQEQEIPDFPANLEWYVSGKSAASALISPGKDTNTGRAESPLASMQQALTFIRVAYAKWKDSWPQDSNGGPMSAVIVLVGEVSDYGKSALRGDMVEINGFDAYPPIMVQGRGNGAYAGILNAGQRGRVFNITDGNKVILTGNLTITGGQKDMGAGIYVNQGECILGGNVRVSGNKATNSGGGIYVSNGMIALTENASVTGNTARTFGGGILVGSQGMCGMEQRVKITGNTASSGGGAYVMRDGKLHIYGNVSITGNQAEDSGVSGGGVYVDPRGEFRAERSESVNGNTPTNITVSR
jgi:predicted outer membrane repeat protein